MRQGAAVAASVASGAEASVALGAAWGNPFNSLDYHVGAGEQSWRHLKAERLGGFEVDDKLEFRRLFDRDVGRLRTAQNLVHIVCRAPEQIREVWSIRHQTSRFGELADDVSRRQSPGEGQGVDLDEVGGDKRVADNIESVCAVLERSKAGAMSSARRISKTAASRPSVPAAVCASAISSAAKGYSTLAMVK
jgi:hypothetical protein